MATLSAQVSPTGITAPDYSDIFAQLQNAFWQIYGTDADLDPDSQDGQFLAILAQAIYDNNMLAVAVYNAYSPATAQGAGLSSVVKINGIRRDAPTDSTALITCAGTYGLTVAGGIVGDDLNLQTQWELDTFTFPISGSITVTATCTVAGAVAAGVGTLNQILTPMLGWASATNADAATVGAPVETDSALRQRQAQSTSLPAQTPLESIYANVANVAGVQQLRVYENDTNVADGDGIPPHSICAVVQGGDAVAICEAIAAVKSPGTGTYGTTSEVVVDENSVPNTINFYVLALVSITVEITVEPLAGWSTSTEALIQQSVAAFVSGLGIGVDDYLNKLWAPANLSGDVATTATDMTQPQLDALSATYNVTSITQAIGAGPQEPADVDVLFNQAATATTSTVSVVA